MSIFLVALGAILTWAVTFDVRGVRLPTVGVILMVAGAVGLLLSLLASARAGAGRSRRVVRQRDTTDVV